MPRRCSSTCSCRFVSRRSTSDRRRIPRARDVSDALLADPADPRTLHEWGRAVGASSRTLARAFLTDTGLSFGRWRTLVRLQASLPHLAEQLPVSAVATPRRIPDDERIRRRVPRPHRSHAGPLLPAAVGSVTPEARHRRRPGRGTRRAGLGGAMKVVPTRLFRRVTRRLRAAGSGREAGRGIARTRG